MGDTKFDSMDRTLKCDQALKSCGAVLYCGSAVVCLSIFPSLIVILGNLSLLDLALSGVKGLKYMVMNRKSF